MLNTISISSNLDLNSNSHTLSKNKDVTTILKQKTLINNLSFRVNPGDEFVYNFSKFKRGTETEFVLNLEFDDGTTKNVNFYEGMLSLIRVCEIFTFPIIEYVYTQYSYDNNGKFTYCVENRIEIFPISDNKTELEEFFIKKFRDVDSTIFEGNLVYMEINNSDLYNFKIINLTTGVIQYYIDYRYDSDGSIRSEFEYYDIAIYRYPLPNLIKKIPGQNNSNVSTTAEAGDQPSYGTANFGYFPILSLPFLAILLIKSKKKYP